MKKAEKTRHPIARALGSVASLVVMATVLSACATTVGSEPGVGSGGVATAGAASEAVTRLADASATPATSPTPAEPAEPSPSPSVTLVAVEAEAAAPAPPPDAEEGTALTAALALEVKGRAAKTGYERDQFGSGWVDVDRNGCDTRSDMLLLRLTAIDVDGKCKVMAGDLADPYTGTSVHFVRGGKSEVDIDHIVALSDAWQKGAANWPFAQRVAFANDPLNLEPVDAGANRQKSDGDAATWLPFNKAFRCEYVARQVAVKTKYDVWVTTAELEAITRVFDACPDEPMPSFGSQPILAENTGGPAPTSTPKETAAPAPKKTVEPKAEPEADLDERFPYCKDLPSGYGPYVKDADPEYEWYSDRDGDGVVCE